MLKEGPTSTVNQTNFLGDHAMNAIIKLPLILLAMVFASVVTAGEPDSLFQSSNLLNITITGPFGLIDKDRDKEEKYKNVTMSYNDDDGNLVLLDVELEVRGKYRLKKDVCRFSQLWINFKKKQVEGTLFENQDKLKLVVQCRSPDRYADYLVKEQQAYQLFNQLSDISLASRLVKATYVDSERKDDSRTQLAFFVEHHERLADRFELNNFKQNRITIAQLDHAQASLVTMFMYMISNTDYSIIQGSPGDDCCHNAKLLGSQTGKYLPVPYDFDSSGYVDASYAEPDQSLRQRNVRQRLYRGFCLADSVMEVTVAKFQAQREAIASIVNDTSYVSSRVANRSLAYINDFFEVIDNPSKLQSEIINECRN